jgi:hypothetical protein
MALELARIKAEELKVIARAQQAKEAAEFDNEKYKARYGARSTTPSAVAGGSRTRTVALTQRLPWYLRCGRPSLCLA